MLKIRFTRKGKKNKSFFRLVVAEHTAPIKGRFLEVLGFLNPHTKERNLKVDRVKYWLGKGAQCSDTAHNLLVKEGLIRGSKRSIKIRKKEEGEQESKEKVKIKSIKNEPKEKVDEEIKENERE